MDLRLTGKGCADRGRQPRHRRRHEADWDRVLEVNLKGCFNYARAATPVFRQQSGGRIVNIASINGIRGKFGQANYAAASKGGMIALTKTLARELGRFAVTVNAVAPGMVATDLVRDLPEEFSPESRRGITPRAHCRARGHRQRGVLPVLGTGTPHHGGMPAGRWRAGHVRPVSPCLRRPLLLLPAKRGRPWPRGSIPPGYMPI